MGGATKTRFVFHKKVPARKEESEIWKEQTGMEKEGKVEETQRELCILLHKKSILFADYNCPWSSSMCFFKRKNNSIGVLSS